MPPRFTGSGLAVKDRLCGSSSGTDVGREVGFGVGCGVSVEAAVGCGVLVGFGVGCEVLVDAAVGCGVLVGVTLGVVGAGKAVVAGVAGLVNCVARLRFSVARAAIVALAL